MSDTNERPDANSETSPSPSRRRFLRKTLQLGTAGLTAPLFLAACGGGSEGDSGETAELSCAPTDLAPEAQQMRESVQYVAETPNENERCNNCQHWQPDNAEGECGGCAVLQGTVAPQGYCTLWVAQTA